jgi:hypothetical protein
MSLLPRTACEIGAHLPTVLAHLATEYMTATRRTRKGIAMAGEYEHCLATQQPDIYSFYGACKAGHVSIARMAIAKGARYWNQGLRGACCSGNAHLVAIIIQNGATEWNYGLYGACRGGHWDIVQNMIAKGANRFQLYNACRGGNLRIVQLMITNGATTDCESGLEGACRGGHSDVVQLMIDLGARDWNQGFLQACRGGHAEIARRMMALGSITQWHVAIGAGAARNKGHDEILRMLGAK